jgi:hypothetical protein
MKTAQYRHRRTAAEIKTHKERLARAAEKAVATEVKYSAGDQIPFQEELALLTKVIETVAPLSLDARKRVIGYLVDRLCPELRKEGA